MAEGPLAIGKFGHAEGQAGEAAATQPAAPLGRCGLSRRFLPRSLGPKLSSDLPGAGPMLGHGQLAAHQRFDGAKE
jgi:hypothetical protein